MRKSKVRGTLLTSLLSLLISFAMLVGSTFAWFTDTASTNVNKIQAGKLEIDLEVYENGQWVSAQDKMLSFQKAAGAEGQAIIWEPGCTYELPKLRVVNKGNLAVKYQISITGINGNAKLNEVIDWTIEGQPINLAIETLAAGTNGPDFVLKGHMQETAGNEYQGLYLDGMTITVYATQTPAEYDSFDNQYDAEATYPGSLPTEVTLSDADFTETTTNYGKYARERFAAAGLECVVDVYESTVPNPAAFKLTLEEAAEDQADFIITKEDGSKAYVKLVLEGYEADTTDPEISIEFIGATAIEGGANAGYEFYYDFTGTNAEGEDFASVAGLSKK